MKAQKRNMKKIILGVILGLVAALAFIVFGGGRLLTYIGKETATAGKQLTGYERKMKNEGSKVKSGAVKLKRTIEQKLDE